MKNGSVNTCDRGVTLSKGTSTSVDRIWPALRFMFTLISGISPDSASRNRMPPEEVAQDEKSERKVDSPSMQLERSDRNVTDWNSPRAERDMPVLYIERSNSAFSSSSLCCSTKAAKAFLAETGCCLPHCLGGSGSFTH